MRKTLPALLVIGLLVQAAGASAAGPIDTTGIPKTGYPNLTLFGPLSVDNTGSTLAETFVTPAGVTKITSFSAIVGASGNVDAPMLTPSAQATKLELYLAAPGGAPTGAPLKSENIVIALGASSIRTFAVDWTVL